MVSSWTKKTFNSVLLPVLPEVKTKQNKQIKNPSSTTVFQECITWKYLWSFTKWNITLYHLKLTCRPSCYTDNIVPCHFLCEWQYRIVHKSLSFGPSPILVSLFIRCTTLTRLINFSESHFPHQKIKSKVKKRGDSTYPITLQGLNNKYIQNAYHIIWENFFRVMELLSW